MDEFEDNELSYENIDWGKTTQQRDINYVPELRFEDIDTTKTPIQTPIPKRKVVRRPKPAQPTTFQFGPMQQPAPKPSTFRGTPLSGGRRGYFDVEPSTEAEWQALTPTEKLAFHAARERKEGRVLPSVRQSTPAEIAAGKKQEEQNLEIKRRLEGKTFFGVGLPETPGFMDNDAVREIRQGFGHAHDVLTYQTPNVFLKGLASTPEGVAEIGRYLGNKLVPKWIPLSDGPASPMMRRFTNKASEVIEEAFPTREEKNPLAIIGGSAAQFVIPGGALSKIGVPGQVTAGLLGAAMNAQQVADEMDRIGVPAQRRDRAIGFAIATGLTEMAGLGEIVDKFGVRQTFTRELLQIAEEGGQEAVQQWLNNLNAKLVGGWDPNRKLSKDVVENAILGIGGGLMSSGINRAAIRDRERALLSSMGKEAPPPTQMELPFGEPAAEAFGPPLPANIPAEKILPSELLPPELKPVNITPAMKGKREKVAGEYNPPTELPKLEGVEVKAPDITSFKVKEGRDRKTRSTGQSVTKVGPRVPLDIIPVDDILGNKVDYTPEEREAAKSKSVEALEAGLKGEPYPIPVPPPPVAAIIGPPGRRGVARVPDVNRVKDQLHKIYFEAQGLNTIARNAINEGQGDIADAAIRRMQEITSDIQEHIDFIEQNGEDGETFEILPASTPGQAPTITVPGWVIQSLIPGMDHMAMGGVAVNINEVTDIIRDLKDHAPSTNAEMKAYRAIDELREQADAEGVNSITFVHQWMSEDMRNKIIPHETFHAAQYTVAKLTNALGRFIDVLNGRKSATLSQQEGPWNLHNPDWAKNHPVIQKAVNDPTTTHLFDRPGIDPHDLAAVEIPAYIVGNEGDRFGLSEDKQVEFVLDYLENIYQTHGVIALDTFERVARHRPEMKQVYKEARNRYEVWKQSQLEQWHESVKAITTPIVEEFTGFTKERFESSDPFQGILGPRQEGTESPTDKTAARLSGENYDQEAADIRAAMFEEREGWEVSEDWSEFQHYNQGYVYGSIYKNYTGTYTADAYGKNLGDSFQTEWEAKDAVQKAADKRDMSREALERRGLYGLVKAFEQRLVDLSNEGTYHITFPEGNDGWRSFLATAMWENGSWSKDPVMQELTGYLREAYPDVAKDIEESKRNYKETATQGSWENKPDWLIKQEEAAAIEAIPGPTVKFTDVEFTEKDQKRLDKLTKKMGKFLEEKGFKAGDIGRPSVEEWLDTNVYPYVSDKIKEEHEAELTEWKELKDREYQSKGGKRGLRLKNILPEDLPLDPRGGQEPREGWVEGTKYYNEVGENAQLRTGNIGNMHFAEVYPVDPENVVDEGRWGAIVDMHHVGYYPDRMWAMAAAERALDKVDVSWQSVQRRNPELADMIKRAIMQYDPGITFGSRDQFYERMDKVISTMANRPGYWNDKPNFSELQSAIEEMFPEAAAMAAKSQEMEAKRNERYAQMRAEDEAADREAEYKLREDEAIHAIRDPRAEMMAQIRKEIAEEKKQRAKDEGSLTRLTMVIDPATSKPGDRVRREPDNKYGSINSLQPNDGTAKVTFDDGTTEDVDIDKLHTAISPPTVATNKVVPQTPAQQAVAQNPVVPSAVEEMQQMALPGMQKLLDNMKQNRPPDLAAFDATLNDFLITKGIKPDATRRPFIQVLEGMITGKIKADEVHKMLEANNLTMEQFMNEFKATALESENSSRQLMRIKMRWLRQLKKNPDLQSAMVFTPSELFKSVMEDINNTKLGLTAWQRASNFIRMLMLSDINTAAVNGLMTAGRIPLAQAVHGTSSWMKTMNEGRGKGMNLGQRIQQANENAWDAMRAAGQVLLVMNPADMVRNWRQTGTSHAERHTAIWNQLVDVFPELEMKVKAPGIGLEGHATISGQIDVAKDLIAQMRTKESRQKHGAELKVAEDRLNSSRKILGRVANGFEVGMELLLSPMRWQEWFFRKPMFVGYLDLALRRRNMSLEELLRTNELESIPQDALKEAMDEALDFTYAYMPAADGPGFEKSAFHIIKGINEMKGVAALVGTMFPRAVYNGMKFAYEYSPVGAFPGIKKMLRPEFTTDPVTNETTRTNPLTQKDYDRFAKAMAGTVMFTAAMSLIKFGLVGDDWWQLKTGKRDKNGKPIYADVRRYQPFSIFMRMADLTARLAHEAGTDFFGKKGVGDIQYGKEIKETLTGMKSFPGAEEYLSATVEMWNDQEEETNVYQKAASSMGVSISFLTRPFVNLRRAVAMFDEDEAKRRDVKGTGILGPMMDNIPWVRQKMLPEYVSMTEKAPVYNESYPGAAFVGVRLSAAEGFAGREWRRLGFLNRRFLAPDPNPAINRKQNEVFQNIITNVGNSAETNPAYLELDDKGKAAYWERLVDKISPIARKIGETADPQEMIKRKFRERLNMGPLQRKNLGLNNIFNNPAPTPTP